MLFPFAVHHRPSSLQKKGLALVFSIFFCTPLKPSEFENKFIVWNVGQGAWSTLIYGPYCLHFDAGGDRHAFLKLKSTLKKECAGRINQFYFTHWDWDHVSLVRDVHSLFSHYCCALYPRGRANAKKKQMLHTLPTCKNPTQIVRELLFPLPSRIDSNSASRVFVVAQKILISGDSPAFMEKHWREHPAMKFVSHYVLGHHGSRTSSSPQTLEQMRELKTGIASSEPRRYGHPHAIIVKRLQKHRVSLLKTKSWGNLYFSFY